MRHVLEIKPVRFRRGPCTASTLARVYRSRQSRAQANDNRDIILSRGQSFILDRKSFTVVYALKEAVILVGPAGHITAAVFDPAAIQGRGA